MDQHFYNYLFSIFSEEEKRNFEASLSNNKEILSNFENYKFSIIEEYLLNQVTETERTQIEQLIETNPTFANDIQRQKIIIQHLNTQSEIDAVKSTISDLRNEVALKNSKGNSSLPLRHLWWGIPFLLLIPFFYWFVSPSFQVSSNEIEKVDQTSIIKELHVPVSPSLVDSIDIDTIPFANVEDQAAKRKSLPKKQKEINSQNVSNSIPVEAPNSIVIASNELQMEDYLAYLPKEMTRSAIKDLSLMEKANRAFDKRDFESAYTHYTSLEPAQKTNARTLYKLGFSALLTDNLEIAIAAFNQVIKQQSISYTADAEWHLALAVYQKGDTVEARKKMKIISENPEHRFHSKAKLFLAALEK